VVTPPATAGPAGSLAPGSAKYAIPAGAVFVSPGGSGAGKGTQSSPYTSLAGAIATARSGSTLVLRGGTYHENVTVPSYKSLTIQSYPGEAVWLDGSSQVSSWTQSGRTWIHTGWTARFSSEPTYTPGSIPSGKAWQFVNPAYPMAAHPDQVWIDGAALTQVGSAAAVGPGEFYADYANKRLVIGSSPSGHDVQASDLDLAITVNSPNSHVRGIGVLDYATPVDEFGTVQLNGSGDSIENVVIMNSATAGLTVSAPNVTVRQVTIQGCGMLGVHAVYADNFTVIGLLAQNNNTEHFNQAPVSGGVKITRSRVVTIENGVFRNNLGPGVWVDESSYDLTLVGNRITGNTGHGVAYEISSVGILANNVVQNNGGDGFKINDSDHVQLWNNLISGNGQNVLIAEDQRRGSNPGIPGHDPRQHTPESWLILDDSLMNNVIGTAGGYPAYIRDYSGQYSMAQLNMQVNGNQFTRTGSVEMVWGLANHGVATFTSMAQFTAATGQGGHNIDPVGGSSPAAVAAAAASAAPLPLPADVAAAIGQPAGIEHRGAFLQ
jgi:parallel beta-helix repeat protein